MSAVVGVLNENLVESIKGFYKLRKAYTTLDSMLEAERKYLRSRNSPNVQNTRKNSLDSLNSNRSMRSANVMPGGFGSNSPRSAAPQNNGSIHDLKADPTRESDSAAVGSNEANEDDVDEFYDVDEAKEGTPTTDVYLGSIEVDEIARQLEERSLQTPTTPIHQDRSFAISKSLPIKEAQETIEHDPDSDIFTNPIDVFIHSGANLCFGLLLLLLSLIPPAFSKLLLIIGFRGDRDRGIRMLWQASKFHNINGAMAGLVVIGYYNVFIGFSDIIPDTKPTSDNEESNDIDGYPAKRLESLLADMRIRYPESRLWLLEESRMQAINRRLDVAIDLLNAQSKSSLKQVEAISVFEKALDAMYSHRYELCADSFILCCSLNNWSHALYYYIAGACHVELYRNAKAASNPVAAEKHSTKANELLQKIRAHAGKKKFMARQLPFDVFVVRKLSKWEARAKDWNAPLIDAIGVSPIEEMIYFWNGYKRMNTAQLQESLDTLSWSEDPTRNPHWSREGLDEKAILAVLQAATFRNLGRCEDAKTILKQKVIVHDRSLFKGALKDDWTAPVAHYEMGANFWMQRRGDEGDGELVREAEAWVEKAARWEGYEMDARIGLKVATAQETFRKWKVGR